MPPVDSTRRDLRNRVATLVATALAYERRHRTLIPDLIRLALGHWRHVCVWDINHRPPICILCYRRLTPIKIRE